MISVVIPAHNEGEYLPACLKSIKQQTLDSKEYEVVVVDDHSSDQTSKIAKQFGAGVIKSKAAPGKSSALNQGLEIAKGEIITTVDADSRLPPNFLAGVKEAFESDSHLDAYTGVGRLVDRERTFYPELLCSLTDLVSAFLFRWFPFLTGPGYAVKKSTLGKIGGYSNEAFEDLALAKRLKECGAKIKLDRDMKVFTSVRRYRALGKLAVELETIRAYLRKHLFNKPNLWKRKAIR